MLCKAGSDVKFHAKFRKIPRKWPFGQHEPRNFLITCNPRSVSRGYFPKWRPNPIPPDWSLTILCEFLFVHPVRCRLDWLLGRLGGQLFSLERLQPGHLCRQQTAGVLPPTLHQQLPQLLQILCHLRAGPWRSWVSHLCQRGSLVAPCHLSPDQGQGQRVTDCIWARAWTPHHTILKALYFISFCSLPMCCSNRL